MGWRSTVAVRAPKSSGSGSPRDLSHTCSTSSPHLVNTLTLSALAWMASKCSKSASQLRPSNTRWRIS